MPGRRPASQVPLVIESVPLVALAALVRFGHVDGAASPDATSYVIVVVGSLAMGIQAVALRRVGQIAVSTTYGTGAVVRLGEKVALAVRHASRPGDARRRVTIAVLSIVLAAYVLGAALAALVGGSTVWLLAVAWVPAVVALANGRHIDNA
jgi:uncharacterized membrane protein YoaK (UPF0700 family)